MKIVSRQQLKQRTQLKKRGARGQSLVEFALVLPILLLLIGGLVDLGRAFFTAVSLNSIISEGAHWAAAYPGCIPSATDTESIDPACQGTNSVVGRMLNENDDLACNRFEELRVEPQTVSDWTTTWVNGVPIKGATVVFNVSYKVDTLMPVTRALFGDSITVKAQAKEVVRGDGVPKTSGAVTDQCSVPPAAKPATPTGFTQQPASAAAMCNNGYATLTWNVQVATGYRLYESDGITRVTGTGDITPSSTTTISVYVGFDASHVFMLKAFTNTGTHEAESDGVLITATCNAVQPLNLQATCIAGGIGLAWTPTEADAAVAGYALIRVSPQQIKTYYVSAGALTSSGQWIFSVPADNPAQYLIQAVAADQSLMGLPSNVVDVNCAAPAVQPAQVQNFRWPTPQQCYNGRVTLMWNQSMDASGYLLQDNNTGSTIDIPSSLTTQYTVTVGSGSSGAYTIFAYVSAATGRLYSVASTQVLVNCPALVAPAITSITCSALTPTGFTSAVFNWTAFSGDGIVAGYKLYRADNVQRASVSGVTTSSTQITFSSGDNPASYKLQLVDVNGSNIGTMSALKALSCPLPGPITAFQYVTGSCLAVSANNRQYKFEWDVYNWPNPVHFIITHVSSGTQWVITNPTASGSKLSTSIVMSKQHEGDLFRIDAVQTSTGQLLPNAYGTTNLPNIGSTCG
ncbi:MAG: pilus assembly protein [Anaerolineae bacterium]|nr:pilus assembly protein [Anaerolineae bacterium]